ncbi:unnamed protein product [Trichogramma brassicae]|uniref:Uncharacterized protein n=1 Tax=Trichogramma brassicae TaxID=86971 RepID=A0A6H5IHJ4_9HYME|nr:unnamed protein product [Trichogramma brassicae]
MANRNVAVTVYLCVRLYIIIIIITTTTTIIISICYEQIYVYLYLLYEAITSTYGQSCTYTYNIYACSVGACDLHIGVRIQALSQRATYSIWDDCSRFPRSKTRTTTSPSYRYMMYMYRMYRDADLGRDANGRAIVGAARSSCITRANDESIDLLYVAACCTPCGRKKKNYCDIFLTQTLGGGPPMGGPMVLVVEAPDAAILQSLNNIVSEAEKAYGANLIALDVQVVQVDRENVDENYEKVCKQLYSGISMILDLTWTGWDKLRELARDFNIIYKRADTTISTYAQAIDDIMMYKNTTDCALIFENEKELNETLYYLIGNSIIRLVVIDYLSSQTVERIGNMRPLPSYYVIYASTKQMEVLFKTVSYEQNSNNNNDKKE